MNDEQKAALDLAVLNLKTHGDDQLLRAVQPLIKYYEEARALLADGGKGEAVYQVQTGDCWLVMTQEQYERHSKTRPTRVLYTAPQAECAPSADARKGCGAVGNMLPAFLEEYKINYVKLLRDIDAAILAANKDK